MFIQLLPLKQWMLMYGYRRSYNTSRLWIQIEYYLSAQHWCVIRPTTSKKKSILIFIFILVLIYMKYLCTFALKPLYTLIVRDMKHTWNIHMSMLFTSHPRLKIKCQKLTRKNLFLLTRGYGLVIIFMGSYQIGSVSLNILFVLTVMHILRTSLYDVYICAHGAWIGKMYSQEIELCIFQMQSYGEMCTECNYYYIYKQNLQYRY